MQNWKLNVTCLICLAPSPKEIFSHQLGSVRTSSTFPGLCRWTESTYIMFIFIRVLTSFDQFCPVLISVLTRIHLHYVHVYQCFDRNVWNLHTIIKSNVTHQATSQPFKHHQIQNRCNKKTQWLLQQPWKTTQMVEARSHSYFGGKWQKDLL